SVDADESAFSVYQRATGVAGIDGGVGLDEVFVVQSESGTSSGADEAHRDGLANVERVTYGQDEIADFDLFAVGDFNGGQVLCVDLEDGDVSLGVLADHLG